jgi:hypothetical protein
MQTRTGRQRLQDGNGARIVKQLIAHLVGDYMAQSEWMAKMKPERSYRGWAAAATHAVIYTACFLPLTRSRRALLIIGGTHLLLDHYRPLGTLLARKDRILSPPGWEPAEPVPFWLIIVVDNTIHLAVNEWALNLSGKVRFSR